MRIRDLELPSPLVIAPMAGVTDYPFRQILREYTNGLISMEMVSEKGINYENQKTLKMIEIADNERPISLQLFGGDVKSIVKAARFLDQKSRCNIIDLNMGCPVKKVLKTGGGADLLKNPERVYEIVSSVVQAVDKPVSVKIRAGFDTDSINYITIGQLAEKAGASAITLHARTRSQFYQGHANWDYIKDLKEHVNIPVIGNGDIKSLDDAINMLEYTKCDGIMIGRGVLGNPFLAQEIEHYLKTHERLAPISNETKIQVALKHLQLAVDYYGEKIGVMHMRSHGAWYLKGMPHHAQARQALNKAQTYEAMRQVLVDYLAQIKEQE